MKDCFLLRVKCTIELGVISSSNVPSLAFLMAIKTPKNFNYPYSIVEASKGCIYLFFCQKETYRQILGECENVVSVYLILYELQRIYIDIFQKKLRTTALQIQCREEKVLKSDNYNISHILIRHFNVTRSRKVYCSVDKSSYACDAFVEIFWKKFHTEYINYILCTLIWLRLVLNYPISRLYITLYTFRNM